MQKNNRPKNGHQQKRTGKVMENFMDRANTVVLQGHLTNVTRIGDGKMVLFGFEGMSSYGKLIINGLTFVGVYEEMVTAKDNAEEVRLIGSLRTYKNKRSGQFEIQIEATDVDYMDYSTPQGQF